MTFSYSIDKGIDGNLRLYTITYSGAVIGAIGNAINTQLRIIKRVVHSAMGSGTLTTAPSFTINEGIITLYAVTATGELLVWGL